MQSLGETIKELREVKKLPLRTVAAYLDIDQAILSKIERGQRDASRELVLKLADFFQKDKNEFLISWLSDKLLNEVVDEEMGLKALQMAEGKIEYKTFKKIDRQEVIAVLKNELKKFSKIQKAWIYGSFSRKEDGPSSDIDIAIQTGDNFSYFDLAEIKQLIENVINRKIDIGFIDSFKPYIFENIKADLKLIYEK